MLLIGLIAGSVLLRADRGFVIAPMMELTACILARQDGSHGTSSDWKTPCTGPESTAAHLVESTLKALQPAKAKSSNWHLGYTLKVPLLAMLEQVNGKWRVNQQALDTVVRTIRDNPRPVVLYLFSTHFGVDAPIELALSEDPANIAHTPQGPLPVDRYYGQPIYPWSVARTDNAITSYRAKVVGALVKGLCQLPADKRNRVIGLTLLGEVHQLFPNFESGMGFGSTYQVSDYSAASVTGFRQYLKARYLNLQTLNQQLGSDYASFEEIDPPSKDIRHEPLRRYHEHMDSFAAGRIPITGWIHVPGTPNNTKPVVQIYLNGKHVADAPVHLSRQDVRAAHPEFRTADLGWRHDLDYSQLPIGIHRLDLALFQPGQPLINLGSHVISIMDKQQKTPVALPAEALPAMQARPPHVTGYTDEPRDQAAYYFNPLARDWQTYREDQVASYLQYFNSLVSKSCLSNTPRYTHQIVPQFNPSWDSGKYAADASLQPLKDLHTGISLYGETSYGSSFAKWCRQRSRDGYGVTEFHPLQAMASTELARVLNQHRANGARFLSFFLETRWQSQRVTTVPNLFSFDPDNSQHASDKLYSSMKELLER